jgi:hypothetical protein
MNWNRRNALNKNEFFLFILYKSLAMMKVMMMKKRGKKE